MGEMKNFLWNSSLHWYERRYKSQRLDQFINTKLLMEFIQKISNIVFYSAFWNMSNFLNTFNLSNALVFINFVGVLWIHLRKISIEEEQCGFLKEKLNHEQDSFAGVNCIIRGVPALPVQKSTTKAADLHLHIHEY